MRRNVLTERNYEVMRTLGMLSQKVIGGRMLRSIKVVVNAKTTFSERRSGAQELFSNLSPMT